MIEQVRYSQLTDGRVENELRTVPCPALLHDALAYGPLEEGQARFSPAHVGALLTLLQLGPVETVAGAELGRALRAGWEQRVGELVWGLAALRWADLLEEGKEEGEEEAERRAAAASVPAAAAAAAGPGPGFSWRAQAVRDGGDRAGGGGGGAGGAGGGGGGGGRSAIAGLVARAADGDGVGAVLYPPPYDCLYRPAPERQSAGEGGGSPAAPPGMPAEQLQLVLALLYMTLLDVEYNSTAVRRLRTALREAERAKLRPFSPDARTRGEAMAFCQGQMLEGHSSWSCEEC